VPPATSRHHPLGTAGLVLLLAVLGVALLAPAAYGHAAGELPHARLSAEGTTVTVQWTAAPDDAADMAVAAGLWPEETFLAYLDVLFGGDEEVLPDADEVAALSSDPALTAYLEDGIRIRQAGQECPGAASPAADFIADGATLTFTCPEPVTQAEVEITLLQDRDPAYRTFSVDGTAQYAVHTSAQPAHPWDFTLAQQDTAGVEVTWLLAGVVGILLAAGAALLRLWPRQRATTVRSGHRG